MICRGALVYRLALCRARLVPLQLLSVELPVRLVPFPVTLSVVVMLLECRARFNFRRLRLVLPNARRVSHWMTI